MGQGKAEDGNIGFFPFGCLPGGNRIGMEVVVRQHYTLGATCGSGRVDHQGYVVTHDILGCIQGLVGFQ